MAIFGDADPDRGCSFRICKVLNLFFGGMNFSDPRQSFWSGGDVQQMKWGALCLLTPLILNGFSFLGGCEWLHDALSTGDESHKAFTENFLMCSE